MVVYGHLSDGSISEMTTNNALEFISSEDTITLSAPIIIGTKIGDSTVIANFNNNEFTSNSIVVRVVEENSEIISITERKFVNGIFNAQAQTSEEFGNLIFQCLSGISILMISEE